MLGEIHFEKHQNTVAVGKLFVIYMHVLNNHKICNYTYCFNLDTVAWQPEVTAYWILTVKMNCLLGGKKEVQLMEECFMQSMFLYTLHHVVFPPVKK